MAITKTGTHFLFLRQISVDPFTEFSENESTYLIGPRNLTRAVTRILSMVLYPRQLCQFPGKVSAAILLWMGAFLSNLAAQPADPGTPFPRLLRTIPAAATAGTESVLTLFGNDLEAPKEIFTNHPGIKAAIVPDEAQKKDPKAAPSPNPKIKVTVAKEVPPGNYGIRLVNAWGVSNLKILPVSDLTVAEEKEPNNDIAQATPLPWKSRMTGTFSGGTDVDYFAIDVPANSPLVIHCQASSIQSPAEPRIELIHPSGRIVATNHHHQGTDALVCQRITTAGKYLIRVSELAYNRGGAEFLYLLYAGPGPWVESARPLAVNAKRTGPIELIGFGLTANAQVKGPGAETITINSEPGQFQPLAFLGRPERRMSDDQVLQWNPPIPTGKPVVPLALPQTNLPVFAEKEPNDTAETAQEIALPADISGGLGKAGDVDFFQFKAKKGEKFRVDLLPTHDGRLTQATLKIVSIDAQKKQTSTLTNKEDENTLQYPKFFQKGLDVSTDFTAPADGTFAVRIASRLSQSMFGPGASYRLRIQASQPAFLAYAVAPYVQNPSSIQIAKGGNAGILIFLQRLDGFQSEVKIQAEGLPAGLTAEPLVISSSNNVGLLVIKAAENAPDIQQPLRLVAESTAPQIKREVVAIAMRTVLPSAAIILPVTGVDPELMVSVRGAAPFLLKATADKESLKPGEKTDIKVQLTRKVPDKTVVAVQGMETPGGILNNNQPQNINADKEEVKLPVTIPSTAAPGTYPLAVRGQSAIPYAKDPAAKQKPATNMVNWSNTVNIEVLPRDLGTFQPTPMESPWKLAKPAKLSVKVTRTAGFTGEIKLSPVDKADGQVKIVPATIPAGSDTVVLNVEVAANAAPGAKTIILLAEGQWKNKFPFTQKIPLNLNLVK